MCRKARRREDSTPLFASDGPVEEVVRHRLTRTAEALAKNGMEVLLADTPEEALAHALSFAPEGAAVSLGGSASLDAIGLRRYFEENAASFRYLDRYDKRLDRAGVTEVFHEALSADVYYSSANAVTENGLVVNVDGNGNRIAALIYGPEKVVLVAGCNKLVKDLPAAADRVRLFAAPANAIRLGVDTPCARTGVCVAYQAGRGFDCEGCSSPNRICRHYHVTARPLPGRVKVILTSFPLGF